MATRKSPEDPADTGRPQLERFLTYRLHLLNKLTDRHSSDAYAEQLGLAVGEARCLAAIGGFAPLSVTDLAARANLNKAQASRAAQALVVRGHVVKSASGVDARGVVLVLTHQGATAWRRAMKLIEQRNHEIFGCLSDKEQAQIGAVFDRLISHARSS